jgi:Nucleotidyl transferase of unknown function (DUF2204)
MSPTRRRGFFGLAFGSGCRRLEAFERDALDRATVVDFGGVRIRVAAPEDLVVYKAVAWRERDRADIERLLARHAGRIDLDRVRSLVREFADALDEPERLAAFDAIVTRATERSPGDRDRSDPER